MEVGGIYHICYEVDNIKESILDLRTKGFFLIQKEAPAIALGNKNVVFLFHKYMGIIELLESGDNG